MLARASTAVGALWTLRRENKNTRKSHNQLSAWAPNGKTLFGLLATVTQLSRAAEKEAYRPMFSLASTQGRTLGLAGI
jgi:hypothetical protein